MGAKKIDSNHIKDKYGSIYHLSPYGEPVPVEGPVIKPEDITTLDMVTKITDGDFAGIKYVAKKLPNLAHFLNIADPFKVAWTLRGGMQPFLLDLIRKPEFAVDLLKVATEFELAIVEKAFKNVAEIHFIMDGDLAQETTMIISSLHYRKYIKPCERAIVQYVHQKGAKIVKHTDGNAWEILDDIKEIGFDGFNPIQPQSMDILKVKQHLDGEMCLIGNIDCRELLCSGAKNEVVTSVQKIIETIGPEAFILSSSNSVHSGVNPENYVTMVNTAHGRGKY